MTVARKIGRNMLWLTVGKVTTVVLALGTVALMTRHLGPQGYGIFRSAQAYMAFALLLANLGLSYIVAREIARPGADQARILGNAMGLRLVTALAVLGAAVLASWLMPYDATIRLGIVLAFVGFVALSCFQTLIAVFQQRLEQAGQVWAEVAGAASLFAAAAVFSRLGLGPLPFIAGMSVAFLLQATIAWLAASRFLVIRPRFEWQQWKALLLSALPLASANLLTLVYYRADTVLLSLFHPPEAVGQYGVATKVLDTVVGFSIMFTGLILPLLSRFAQDGPRFRQYLQASFDALAVAVPGMAMLFFVFAEEVATLIAGPAFAASATPLRILSVTMALMSFSLLLRHAATALDQQRHVLPGFLVAAVLALGIYFAAIPVWAEVGAATGTAVGEAVVVAWITGVLHRRCGLRIRSGALIRAIPAAVSAALVAWLAKSSGLVWPLAFGITGCVYLAGLFALRAITLDTLAMVLGIGKARPGRLAGRREPPVAASGSERIGS